MALVYQVPRCPAASKLGLVRLEGPDLDPAEARHGVLCGYLHRLVEAGAFEYVEASHPLLGFRERAVRLQDFPFRLRTVTALSASTSRFPITRTPVLSISETHDWMLSSFGS